MTPARGLLGSGVSRVQVMATDRLGGDVASEPAKLRVDGQPPGLQAKLERKRGVLVLRLKDAESGLKGGATRISFGDGKHARGGAHFRHHYTRPGRYLVRVRASDRVGNRLIQQLWAIVR